MQGAQQQQLGTDLLLLVKLDVVVVLAGPEALLLVPADHGGRLEPQHVFRKAMDMRSAAESGYHDARAGVCLRKVYLL